DADLNYEGSISIDPKLIELADLKLFEKVEIYNCNNGARLATYVILGKDKEICLNGAAARHVAKGDKVIICSYAEYDDNELDNFKPQLVFVNDENTAHLPENTPKI
ncbi:UNVERIFIED_CONTAM: hypothetical protein GTU68_023583, partial [Idotea baltica]|nr:hypothetical protein [Idotea baltica]